MILQLCVPVRSALWLLGERLNSVALPLDLFQQCLGCCRVAVFVRQALLQIAGESWRALVIILTGERKQEEGGWSKAY